MELWLKFKKVEYKLRNSLSDFVESFDLTLLRSLIRYLLKKINFKFIIKKDKQDNFRSYWGYNNILDSQDKIYFKILNLDKYYHTVYINRSMRAVTKSYLRPRMLSLFLSD